MSAVVVDLNSRRKPLKMPVEALVRRSGVPRPTVFRSPPRKPLNAASKPHFGSNFPTSHIEQSTAGQAIAGMSSPTSASSTACVRPMRQPAAAPSVPNPSAAEKAKAATSWLQLQGE